MSEVIPSAADRHHPETIPLDQIDLIRSDIFHNNDYVTLFARLRQEDPVHLQADHPDVGSFWNISRYEDIMHVETNPEIYSSAGTIVVDDMDERFPLPMFIATDPPEHTRYRQAFNPIFAPANLAKFEDLIRERSAAVLDALPIGEIFDWVDRVAVELTTQMLATLFGFPFEERNLLTRWSDIATALRDNSGIVESEEQRQKELMECLAYFSRLRDQRMKQPPSHDLISVLAHGDAIRNMKPSEYLGNLLLLIVAGNDTSRNSMTGGLWFLNQFPAQYDKLRSNPDHISTMVWEIFRYQSPLAYMRRTARIDSMVGNKTIRAGEKLLMWYISGNFDDAMFNDPYEFLIDRPKVRQNLAFGFGIHRCIGVRLAEMQLRILWQEILQRFKHIEVVGEPRMVNSSFIKGYTSLPVVIHQ